MKPLLEDTKRKEKILRSLPKTPGVYLMKNEVGSVIYVGKAKNLSARIRSYFQSGPKHSLKTTVMVPKISDIEIIKVSTELEALLLEINQIKKYTPKYNVLMKDDKNYAYLKITINEDYPKIFPTRIREKDKALYFGPYMSVKKVEEAVDIVRKLFPYRSCNGTITWKGNGASLEKPVELGTLAIYKENVENKNLGRKTPCLEYHIKRCDAPCLGIVIKEQYHANIQNIMKFLKGNYDSVLTIIEEMMKKAVQERKFEWAAKLRDQMQFIHEIKKKQRVVSTKDVDQDVIAISREGNNTCATLVQIRNGKLLQILHRELSTISDSRLEEALERFILEHYKLVSEFPQEILLSHKLDTDSKVLEDWFDMEMKRVIKILFPQKGQKKDLLVLAEDNGRQYLESKRIKFEDTPEERGLEELKNILILKDIPKRIECYDISHIQGTNTVASMVVLQNGKPFPSHYRRFQVKTVSGKTGQPDDYKSMKEVLSRRLRHIHQEKIQIKIKKTTKTQMNIYVNKKYKKKYKERLEWYSLEYQNYTMIVGVEMVDDTVAAVSTYIHEREIPENITIEMFLFLLYKLKQTHIYFSTVSSESGLFISLGATQVENIPAKYKILPTDGDIFFTWYKKSKKRIDTDVSFASKPDLLIIDGGKGQLSTVYKVMKELKCTDIPVIGIAKQEEEIFIPEQKDAIVLSHTDPALRLIIRARDEAHRFANMYHKEKREKQMIHSALDDIPGIGNSAKMKLLKIFGSVEEIKKAPVETLEEYVGKRIAKIIECYLK